MKIYINLLIIYFFISSTAFAAESLYTDLSEKACQTVSSNNEEGNSSRQLCPGVAGYQLAVLSDDDRDSINIISPDGKEYPLNFWHSISGNFNTLGNTAEWRVIKKAQKIVPYALIVRVKVFEFPEKTEKFTSYLSVSKITGDQICVTDKIKPGPKQNEQARLAADTAAGKPCLESSSN